MGALIFRIIIIFLVLYLIRKILTYALYGYIKFKEEKSLKPQTKNSKSDIEASFEIISESSENLKEKK